MTHLAILPDSRWAGHCTTGKSDKVWAACLAAEREEDAPTPLLASLSDTTQVVFLCVYGPRGANLRKEDPKRLSLKAARALFQSKRIEKAGKGYASVEFAPFLSAFGSPLGLSLQLAPGSPSATPAPSPLLEQAARSEDTPLWSHLET